MAIKRASRSQAFTKVAISGLPGAGKSYTALTLAFALVREGLAKNVGFIDAEHGKGNFYAGYIVGGITWDYGIDVLTSYSPQAYRAMIEAFIREKYDCLIIDQISHEYAGTGGILEIVDKHKNTYTEGWGEATPIHNEFIETVLRVPAHVICTIREKIKHAVVEETGRNGNLVAVPKKIGLGKVQRPDTEYELHHIFNLTRDHVMTVEKTICPAMDELIAPRPTYDTFAPLIEWMKAGSAIQIADYQFEMAGRDASLAIIERVLRAKGNLEAERDWLLKHCQVRDFDQLTVDGLAKYEKVRLSQLEKKSVKKPVAASTPTEQPAQQTTANKQQAANQQQAATLQETLTEANGAAEHPQHPGIDVDALKFKSAGKPAEKPVEQPKQPTQPAPVNGNHVAALTGWTRPPCLDPIIQTSCRTLFEEACFLRGITDHNIKADVWANKIIGPRGFTKESDVTPSAWGDIERELVQKIDAVYVERGTPEASPFHATFRS